jgi:hypothetical protein
LLYVPWTFLLSPFPAPLRSMLMMGKAADLKLVYK